MQYLANCAWSTNDCLRALCSAQGLEAGADLAPLSWGWLADVQSIDAEQARQEAERARKADIARRQAEAAAARRAEAANRGRR